MISEPSLAEEKSEPEPLAASLTAGIAESCPVGAVHVVPVRVVVVTPEPDGLLADDTQAQSSERDESPQLLNECRQATETDSANKQRDPKWHDRIRLPSHDLAPGSNHQSDAQAAG